MRINWEGYSKREVSLYNESVAQDILEKRLERMKEIQDQQEKVQQVTKATQVNGEKLGRIDIYV